MTALKVEKLNKSYPGFSLKDVSFETKTGSVMGFIGKNGAGKTTTLKTLLGLTPRGGGSVSVFGKDFFSAQTECKREMGLVLGGATFYPRKKLKTVAETTALFFGDGWDGKKYRDYLGYFELDETKRIGELSDGMKVKFMLTLALSHNARLLILDEPTSGLDPVARDELCSVFRSIVKNGERSVLFSTHITSDLEKCADEITFIRDGEIQKSCPKDEFITYYAGVFGFGGQPSLEDIIVRAERRERDDSLFDT